MHEMLNYLPQLYLIHVSEKKTLKLKEHHTTIYTLFAEYNMTSNEYRKVGKFKHPFARKETNQNV